MKKKLKFAPKTKKNQTETTERAKVGDEGGEGGGGRVGELCNRRRGGVCRCPSKKIRHFITS